MKRTPEEIEAELTDLLLLRSQASARVAEDQAYIKVTDKMIRALQSALAHARGEPAGTLEQRVLQVLLGVADHRLPIAEVAKRAGTNRNTVAVSVHRHRYTARITDADGELWGFTEVNPTTGVLMAEKKETTEAQARVVFAKQLMQTARELKKASKAKKGKAKPAKKK